MKPFFTLLAFLLLITGFFHPISAITQDLGRHLLTGEIIVQMHEVPKTNLFSYTYPDFPFINHHWLSEVFFYLTYKISGFDGLLIFTSLVVTAAFALVFLFSLRRGNIFAIVIVSILYLRVLFERTDVRPEIFSFLFLSLFITILYRYREQYTRLVFLLPFLELLWVNTHIYFPIGIGVIGLFLIDEIISLIKNPNTKIRNPKQIQMTKIQNTKRFNHLNISILNIVSSFDIRISSLLLVLILCSFAILLNPNGLSGALYPLHVFQNYGYTIEENQNVFFLWNYFGGKTTILFFFISVAALFSTLLLTFKKTRPIDWMLAIFFTILAANAERNFPLFVFATFIPFARFLSFIFDKLAKPISIHVLTFVLVGLLVWQIQQVSSIRILGFGIETGAKNAADFFLEKNLKGPLFNNFDIGSYLEYRLYPKEKVFIDGRPEAYPASFIQQTYIPMQADQKQFDDATQKYNLNTIFFSHTDQTPWAQTFLKWIIEDKEWKLVYLDDYVIIFLKNTQASKLLTQKYEMDRNSLRITNIDKTLLSFLRLANFFRVVGWQEHEEQMYQELLKIDPNSCIALYNLATLLSQKNDPTVSAYIQKFQQFCK